IVSTFRVISCTSKFGGLSPVFALVIVATAVLSLSVVSYALTFPSGLSGVQGSDLPLNYSRMVLPAVPSIFIVSPLKHIAVVRMYRHTNGAIPTAGVCSAIKSAAGVRTPMVGHYWSRYHYRSFQTRRWMACSRASCTCRKIKSQNFGVFYRGKLDLAFEKKPPVVKAPEESSTTSSKNPNSGYFIDRGKEAGVGNFRYTNAHSNAVDKMWSDALRNVFLLSRNLGLKPPTAPCHRLGL
ncbi:UNVERIFIED_CONTAM: hypothetical protein HDU68_001974, partial [Siphonaria sp. JEL0065]